MAIEVTINLDSGCMLQRKRIKKGCYACEIGYFQNPGNTPDIIVFVDGEQKAISLPKLGCENCTIEVRHVMADGRPKRDGVKAAPEFRKYLLHMQDLYGDAIGMDPKKFDCVFRFEAGRFVPSMIKKRAFKLLRMKDDGKMDPTIAERKVVRRVSHNVVAHLTLEHGESLQLVKGQEVIFSTEGRKIKGRLDIEVPVDNKVAHKFYCHAFKNPRRDRWYWMPNDGDPPPPCSQDPCIGT